MSAPDFHPKNGGSEFLRHVGNDVPDCTAAHCSPVFASVCLNWSLPFVLSLKLYIYISCLPRACYMYRSSKRCRFDHPNDIWRRIENMNFVSYPVSIRSYRRDSRGVGVRVPFRSKTFRFSTSSRSVPGPTQPHIQCVPANLSCGV
jgi:hypothetical protein